MRARGYTFLSDPDHQLWELSAIDVPEGVDGKEIQTRILREHDIEVGGGLGPTAPPIWRVGLMGVNANRETADRVLGGVRRGPAAGRRAMTQKDRLHRSELAVPGTNVRAMEKAAHARRRRRVPRPRGRGGARRQGAGARRT